MIMYDEVEYAKTRLVDTVVRLNTGIPVRVMSMWEEDGESMCECFDLVEGVAVVVDMSELDITPVPLGYCNNGPNAQYLMRMPMRRDWKQGLRQNNLTTPSGRPIEIPWEVVAKTIINDYPTLDAAKKRLFDKPLNPFLNPGNVKRVAFSRNFSIDKSFNLEYKGTLNVGDIKNDNYKLLDEYLWVEDELKLALGA